MSYPELPYTIDEFRGWLQSLPTPSSTAGYAGLPSSCPAACWLSDAFDVHAHVDCDMVLLDGARFDAPMWLVDFEDKVDKWPRGEPIGRRQALNLLARVVKARDEENTR